MVLLLVNYNKKRQIAMRKLTLSGEYCFDNEEWINWWGDV